MRFKTTCFAAAAAAILLTSFTSRAAVAWDTFHGDDQRTGFTSAIGPVSPTLAWSVDLGGPIVTSPIVGPDGAVYVGSVWRDTLHPRSFINAINADGTPRWRFETRFVDGQSISTPALGPGGEVYVGAADGAFYALSPTGALLWKHQASRPIDSHPVVADDGTVYVTIAGDLVAFSPLGDILWRFDLGTELPGGPTLDPDGTVYAVASDGIVAVRPDGALKWRQPFVAGGSAPVVVSPNGDIIVAGGWISALDREDGEIKWFINRGWTVSNYGSPAVDEQGNIYYSAYIYVWKISPTGQYIWERTLQEPGGNRLGSTYSSIVVDGAGKLLFGMGTGKRWAIDFEKRIVVWNNQGNEVGSFVLPEATSSSSPALAPDGTLIIGCLDGRLRAFRE